MELRLVNGDYEPDGKGGMASLSGAEEVLARALFRLTARRGAFPFLPDLGSRLHLLLREPPSARQALAVQYAAQALEGERDLKVTGASLSGTEASARLAVSMEWQGETLTAAVELS